jgi:integrase
MYKLYESLTTYPEAMYRGIFLFLLDGRRMSEALKMRWEYVEFEQGTYETIYTINKNRKNLDFTLKDKMRTTLDEIGIRSEGYIFYNPQTKTHFKDFRKRWKAILKDVGIDHMRIHDTRHLIGGLGVDLGFSLEQVGKVLGHQSSQSTKRYSKVRRSTADNVAREIDAAMQKKKATDKQSDLQEELISELQQSAKDLQPNELTQILEMIRSNNNG